MAINYGQVIDTVFDAKHNKCFFITNLNEIYSLIEVSLIYNIENIIIRCSDIQYVEWMLKQELKKWMIDKWALMN